MSPLRRLFVAVLALAGALCWGPPAVLALCLGGGTCGMTAAPKRDATPSCCRAKAEEAPASKAPRAGAAEPHRSCCGCCTNLRVGMGLDGAGIRVDTPVAPPAYDGASVIAAPAAADAFVVPAAPLSPRPPPEKVLPLRI